MLERMVEQHPNLLLRLEAPGTVSQANVLKNDATRVGVKTDSGHQLGVVSAELSHHPQQRLWRGPANRPTMYLVADDLRQRPLVGRYA